ncbi:AP2-like ethylene-responsive transcription factor AIL7 [Henckelia pumila]|uniref:AP2-like ethylene-responsive transcription factor AIL7 n=1 Tax=Henckelia pumila TaxID=405737 RepID=UPI003C6DF0EB
MAPESNWLSFSLQSSMDQMLQPASSTDHSHNYYGFADNFYAVNGWPTSQRSHQTMYPEAENHYLSSFMDSTTPQAPPKLEDFFGGDSTETQDSTLTHIYDSHQAAAYFRPGDQQDLKAITEFEAFSANSGSEVDESSLGFSNGDNKNNSNNKAIVSVESESCKKIADTFGQRTSIYRGVTRHRWTGRYEAHLWDNSCRREGQARKGRQVYLGGYDKEEKAARAYDLAALKYWGHNATTNFPISNYTKEMDEMKHSTKQEFIASIRRKSSGFSRGASIYRGVTRHHQQGRWQARIGRVAGNKDLYLGTFATEEEAAEAYDIAAIKFRGINAVTNFEMNRYNVEAINRSSLPIGGTAKRLKPSLEVPQENIPYSNILQPPCNSSSSSSIDFATFQPVSNIPCGVPLDLSVPFYHHGLFHHLHTSNPLALDASAASPMVPELFIWPNQSNQH